MPKIKVNGVDIYYEIGGCGEPVLLIEGLGYATWQWFRQIEELTAAHRTLVFDNRGVGESDKPDIPFTIEDMADDAGELLKALGLSGVHVLGTSMGGYIAQKVALRNPELVKSLVLACTSFGGPNSIPITERALNSMLNVAGLTPGEIIRQGFQAAFSPEFFSAQPELIDELADWRLRKPTPHYAWERQFQAVGAFNNESELGRIDIPTLVITGSEDIVIPPENSVLLAERIPKANLIQVHGGGHLFFIEKAAEFNRQVLDFWQKVK